MNQAKIRRAQASAPAAGRLARAGSLTAVASAVLAVSMPVMSQGTQTITVTGIRRGVESAISVKKNNEQVVEAISAEDIGKLPDTSIAESLARLPGVNAQRTAGRAQAISFRGFAPDFSTGLLNGREQVSTGDSRFSEFDQYPSELLNAVVVYKTPNASLVGQGLSATVDMQTIKPLDFGRRTVAVNYRKQKSGVGLDQEGDGSRFSLAYIDQFADRKIGVALGFARLKEDGPVTTRFESWGGGQANFQGNNVNVPFNGFNAWSDQTTQTRDGAMAALQFKPNKNFSTSVDFFQSKFTKDSSKKGFQAPLNDSWNGQPGNYDSGGRLTSATLNGNDVTAGTFDNVRGVVRNDTEHTEDKLTSIGWNTKAVMGAWTATADLSSSKAERTGGIIETTAGTAQSTLGTAQLDSVQFTAAGQFTPGLNYADRNIIRLTDVQGWGGGVATPQAGYSKLPAVEDKLDAVKLSLGRDLPDGMWFSRVEGGLHYGDRKKTRAFIEGRLEMANGDPLGSAAIPGTSSMAVGGTGIVVATFDPSDAVGSIYRVAAKQHPDIFNKDWTVSEKITTAFVQGSIDRTLFGLPVTGNAGVQLISAKQSSTAFNVDNASCVNDACSRTEPNTAGITHTDVLPSLNLNFDLGSDTTLRLGLAKQMARPILNDMRASFSFALNTNDNFLRGSAGNPELKPWRATALDLSYESYFGTKAYWAAAAFYKKLDSYILKQNIVFDFKDYINPSTPLPTLPPGADPALATFGLLELPVNGSGGYVKGVEWAGSFPLNMLDKSLDGFGVQASIAANSSSVRLQSIGFQLADVNGNPALPLPGLSKRSGNITVYFEKAGFGLRVAQRYRSAFLGEITDFAGDRRLTFIKGERVVDAQISYEFQSGFAKGLSVLFQGSNLNNAEFVRYRAKPITPATTAERTKYGSFYLLGINYKI